VRVQWPSFRVQRRQAILQCSAAVYSWGPAAGGAVYAVAAHSISAGYRHSGHEEGERGGRAGVEMGKFAQYNHGTVSRGRIYILQA